MLAAAWLPEQLLPLQTFTLPQVPLACAASDGKGGCHVAVAPACTRYACGACVVNKLREVNGSTHGFCAGLLDANHYGMVCIQGN